jgi:glycerol uptake facilitator-like aquaporin
MLDISFAGLIGAFIGTVIAALAYAPLLLAIERRLRPRATAGADSTGHAETGIMQQEISLLRRGVLAADIAVFAGLGYWLAAGLANW